MNPDRHVYGLQISRAILLREALDEEAPWRWYCRIDGESGEYSTREERDSLALQHRDQECQTRDLPTPEWKEAGHLVHVWRW
jgi:hypothetical protein